MRHIAIGGDDCYCGARWGRRDVPCIPCMAQAARHARIMRAWGLSCTAEVWLLHRLPVSRLFRSTWPAARPRTSMQEGPTKPARAGPALGGRHQVLSAPV